MKRVSTTLALALGAFTTFSSAAQIQGFVSGYAPGNVNEKSEVRGAEFERDLHSDFVWGLGAEFLAFPVGPLMVGGGLGYISMQKDGSDNLVMPAVPLWGSVGVIGPDEWAARPYFEVRVGYPLPAASFKTWWDKPSNFFVSGNVGVQLPYYVGVEFNYAYLTMNKTFKDQDVNFRFNSFKVGGSITVHFDLFKSAAESDDSLGNMESFASKPATEDSSNSSESSDVSEYSESTASEEPSYSDYYSDQPAEQPAEESVSEESAAEPVAESSESASYAEEPSEEQPAEVAEESPAEEPVAEESTEEAPAEEAVAEEAPVEEPVAEPVPEPEKKPAAKKASSKKKTSKKSSKKTTKKKTTSKKKSSKKKR